MPITCARLRAGWACPVAAARRCSPGRRTPTRRMAAEATGAEATGARGDALRSSWLRQGGNLGKTLACILILWALAALPGMNDARFPFALYRCAWILALPPIASWSAADGWLRRRWPAGIIPRSWRVAERMGYPVSGAGPVPAARSEARFGCIAHPWARPRGSGSLRPVASAERPGSGAHRRHGGRGRLAGGARSGRNRAAMPAAPAGASRACHRPVRSSRRPGPFSGRPRRVGPVPVRSGAVAQCPGGLPGAGVARGARERKTDRARAAPYRRFGGAGARAVGRPGLDRGAEPLGSRSASLSLTQEAGSPGSDAISRPPIFFPARGFGAPSRLRPPATASPSSPCIPANCSCCCRDCPN